MRLIFNAYQLLFCPLFFLQCFLLLLILLLNLNNLLRGHSHGFIREGFFDQALDGKRNSSDIKIHNRFLSCVFLDYLFLLFGPFGAFLFCSSLGSSLFVHAGRRKR